MTGAVSVHGAVLRCVSGGTGIGIGIGACAALPSSAQALSCDMLAVAAVAPDVEAACNIGTVAANVVVGVDAGGGGLVAVSLYALL